MNRSARVSLAVTVAAIVAMSFATAASAAVTTSHVNAPSSPHFSILTPTNQTFAVTGTTNGTTGDEVDLQCYYGAGKHHAVLTAVPVIADGSFSVPNVELAKVDDSVCTLLAVPAGTNPPSLAPYTGPLLATGEASDRKIATGVNTGHLYDFYVWAQQQTAAFDYVSAGDCGVYDGYLFDSSLEETATTFYCNDGFYNQPAGFNRSAIQVDGVNAYVSDGAKTINETATNLPSFSYSVSQNPVNGDTTIQESDGISACPVSTFPPAKASCPSFVDTGVRLDRTIVQSNDGHLATITDHFVSVDGKPHSVDTLTENDQNFSAHAKELGYLFPGRGTYLSPAEGQVVPFPDANPGTVYVRVEGSPDGDTATGRGAIIFADPSSPATFAGITTNYSEFYLHQTAAIPAGGSVTKRFAYAQGYTQNEVESLAHQAEAAFQPVVVPPAPAPKPAPTPVAPSNKVKLLGSKLNKKKGTALLKIEVPAPGKLTLSGKKVKTAKRAAKRAGVVKVTVTPRPKFAKALTEKGKLKVALKIGFAPTGGSPRTVHRSLTLVRK